MAKQVRLPASHRPGGAEQARLAGCQSTAFYYGYEGLPDFVKARHCAYMEIDRNDAGDFGGRAMLAMIYANGKGVARNLGVAIKLACEAGSATNATGEVKRRVTHLLRLKSAPDQFDFCDDITSSYMIGACASLRDEFQKVQFRRRLKTITARWPPGHQQAFQPLQAAWEAFVHDRTRNEFDLMGLLRAVIVIEEEAKLREQFIMSLERFEQGKLPLKTRDASQVAAMLEKSREKVRQWKRHPGEMTSISPEGLKQSQETWVRYRSAWIAFGRIRYVAVATEAWQVWLDGERLRMLELLLTNELQY